MEYAKEGLVWRLRRAVLALGTAVAVAGGMAPGRGIGNNSTMSISGSTVTGNTTVTGNVPDHGAAGQCHRLQQSGDHRTAWRP